MMCPLAKSWSLLICLHKANQYSHFSWPRFGPHTTSSKLKHSPARSPHTDLWKCSSNPCPSATQPEAVPQQLGHVTAQVRAQNKQKTQVGNSLYNPNGGNASARWLPASSTTKHTQGKERQQVGSRLYITLWTTGIYCLSLFSFFSIYF